LPILARRSQLDFPGPPTGSYVLFKIAVEKEERKKERKRKKKNREKNERAMKLARVTFTIRGRRRTPRETRLKYAGYVLVGYALFLSLFRDTLSFFPSTDRYVDFSRLSSRRSSSVGRFPAAVRQACKLERLLREPHQIQP